MPTLTLKLSDGCPVFRPRSAGLVTAAGELVPELLPDEPDDPDEPDFEPDEEPEPL